MFSNTAYEALYQYLGLELHSKFVEVITSQKVFGGVVLLIFGILFLLTSVQFFSRYMPGALVNRRHVPLSKYVRIVACLFLGIGILKVGSNTSVKRFDGESWHQNRYISGQVQVVKPEYRVSFVFDLMSRTAEEIAALIARVVDGLFQSTHSQLDAPNFFFKAIMYAGAATIDDPALKRSVRFYTEECFDRVLPLVKSAARENKLDGFFADSREFDQKLSSLTIETRDTRPYTCLDVKDEVREGLKLYALARAQNVGEKLDETVKPGVLNSNRFVNLEISSFLVNHYLDSHEGYMGVQKGSQLPTTTARVFQYVNRFLSWDGLLSVFGGKNLHGAALAASRSQEFSENLARAPHVAGFIKMLAIAIFPWLLFLVVAGYWRALVYWFLIYFSVLLWAPIWTLLYHVMVGISLSAETMAAFGKLSDGVSLYAAELVSSRMYHLFAVYSWLQLLTGTLFTGLILYFLRPAFGDTEADSAPEFIDTSKHLAATGTRAAGAVL